MLCFLLSNYLLRQMFVRSDKEKKKNNLPQQFSVFLPPWQPAFEKPTHQKMAFSLILFFFFEDLQYIYYNINIILTQFPLPFPLVNTGLCKCLTLKPVLLWI